MRQEGLQMFVQLKVSPDGSFSELKFHLWHSKFRAQRLCNSLLVGGMRYVLKLLPRHSEEVNQRENRIG